MMKVIIIEDEAPAARRLQKMIGEIDPSIEAVAVLESVKDSIDWLSKNDMPDVIFSDIQLADGKSFDVYSSVEIDCPIIFTTAYDEFAIKAFDYNGIAYLLKPFSSSDLEKAISKIQSKEDGANHMVIDQLIKSLNTNKEYKNRFLINKGESLIPVSVDDIAYVYTQDKMVVLMTKDKKKFYLNQTLDEIEKQLNPKEFFRLNRQFIAGYKSIEKVENHFNGKLKTMLSPATDEPVMISRIKAPAFKSWLSS